MFYLKCNFYKNSKWFVILSIGALSILVSPVSSQNFSLSDSIISPTATYVGSSFFDYDNNGSLDLIKYSNRTIEIYKNTGGGHFVYNQTLVSVFPVVNYPACELGDFNNDGFQDVLIVNCDYVCLYLNNGDSTFSAYNSSNIQSISAHNCCASADYNNDGTLDILISNSYEATLYKNNGNGSFTALTGTNFYKIDIGGDIEWMDFDNDGFLDVLMAGTFGSNIHTYAYRNNGDDTFTLLTSVQFPAQNLSYCSFSCGDYDADGYTDILFSGQNGGDYSRIYRNNGNLTFSYVSSISLHGAYSGKSVWYDYDNDGRLDILLTGHNLTYLYHNDGAGIFSAVVSPFGNVNYCDVSLGDYDNDHRADVLLSGTFGSNRLVKIFHNITDSANLIPSIPNNLISTVDEDSSIVSVNFKWNQSNDNSTPQNALLYNLYIYDTNSVKYIKPPDAFPYDSTLNGTPTLPYSGNIHWDTSGYTIYHLSGGVYKWSVQAIDNSHDRSSFSGNQLFVVNPGIQAHNITPTNLQPPQFSIEWDNGSGQKRAVFVKQADTGYVVPFNHTTYMPDTVFGAGAQIGTSGWYCVYNDTGSFVTVTGIIPQKSYRIFVFEYVGSPGYEIYNSTIANNNPKNIITYEFIEQTDTIISGFNNGNVVPGDYNADGFIDLFVTGCDNNNTYITKIYKNVDNGIGGRTFLEVANLPGMTASRGAWGDYDNDNDLDIAFIGTLSGGPDYTYLYQNLGNDVFSQVTSASFSAFNYGSITWGDYNNDGLKDLLLSGSDNAAVYRNDGSGHFSSLFSGVLPGATNGSFEWGDYNNDSYLDILAAGKINTPAGIPVAKIFKNADNGSGERIFQEQTLINNIVPLYNCEAAWVDIDNDGDLDFDIMGLNGVSSITIENHLYINNGNETFTESASANLPALLYATMTCGDYNNDGLADIFMCGALELGPLWLDTYCYKNNGDGTFTDFGFPFPHIYYSSAAWADYDNDGRLDLFLSGYGGVSLGRIFKIYKNNYYPVNVLPQAPAYLSSNIDTTGVTLYWDKSFDAETGQDGLFYNICLYDTSSGDYAYSPQSLVTGSVYDGKPMLAHFGSVCWNPDGYKFSGIGGGNFIFTVQAIDNELSGSPFSAQLQINNSTPYSQTFNLYFTNITSNQADIHWTCGNGSKRAVFIRQDTNGFAHPMNNITYHPNAMFNSGDQIGSTGWYCVYNDTGSYITVTGLVPNTTYKVMVCDYYGGNGVEQYNFSTTQNNPKSFTTLSVGIADISMGSMLNCYPNPFIENTRISFPNQNNEVFSLIIYNQAGDVVKIIDDIRGTYFLFYRENLTTGLYTFTLKSCASIYHGKLMIK